MKSPTKKQELLSGIKLAFYKEVKAYQQTLKPTKELEGFAGAAIVGEKNYPYLKVHNVSNQNQGSSFIHTNENVKKDFKDILHQKARNIFGSTQSVFNRNTSERIHDELQNIYKSKKDIEFSSRFENDLTFTSIQLNRFSGVLGAKNPLQSVESTQNTPTSHQIEKYTQEDVKAREAIISLYERGINEQQIINLLGLGAFGHSANKKLVPTRWSISAYDSTIEEYLHKRITRYPIINNYEVYFYENKSDKVLIIVFPMHYAAEHIEVWSSNEWGGRDAVGFDNKLKTSSPENAGGYFAIKLAEHEFLEERKRQAGLLSIRLIDNYEIPLGVVFVRECAREALKRKVFESSSKEELEEFLKIQYPRHFNCYKTSKLHSFEQQKGLTDFF